MENSQVEQTGILVPEESEFKESDRVAKAWFIFTALWFPIFATFGFLMAVKFFFPTFLSDSMWDSFGRIRPAHVNGVLFGFVSSGLLGAMFWITPRLCARGLYRAKLALMTPFVWNFAILGGIIWILLGGSQGREYAELPWAMDILVMIGSAPECVHNMGNGNQTQREKALWDTVVLSGDYNVIPHCLFHWKRDVEAGGWRP